MLNYKQPQRCAVASYPTPLPPLTLLENSSPNHTSSASFLLYLQFFSGNRLVWENESPSFLLFSLPLFFPFSFFLFPPLPSSTSCHARWLCNGNTVPLGGADFKLSQRRERFTAVIRNFRSERFGTLRTLQLKVQRCQRAASEKLQPAQDGGAP